MKDENKHGLYHSLIVWKKSFELSLAVYRITKHFPETERYGLVSQMRRSAVSVPSNIAEGYARGLKTYFHQFLQIAHGSSAELETQLLISKELGYIKKEEYETTEALLQEVMKMLHAILSKEKKTI